MPDSLTQSIEDYLKAIYKLSAAGGPAMTSDLAARLGVAPASVTGMLQRLAAAYPPLITYRKHRGVLLTAEGERAALEVIRHHRLLETYLVQNLGYSWDEVHAEADRLEHAISEDFEARMAEALGHPEFDPHGDPIPGPDLAMPPAEDTPLSSLRSGQKATVQRVRADDASLLKHLERLGLTPGTHLEVLEFSPFDLNLRIRIGQEPPFVLGYMITGQVFVRLEE
jgi:DtxR family transcriptional regulator, Mn-dependent transcriptional regulator